MKRYTGLNALRATQLLSARSTRFVAAGRAALSLVMLASTLVSTPPDLPVQILLSAYSVFALAALYLIHRRSLALSEFNNPAVMLTIDCVSLTVLLYMTGGADSPFFSPLYFIVLCALIQWGWRGAAMTGVGLLGIFLPTVWEIAFGTESGELELLTYFVRIGNLGVSVSLLIFFGRHVERVIDELARLSDPVPDSKSTDLDTPVVPCLQHALNVFGARRGVFVWSEDDEPWSQAAIREADGSVRRVRLAPGDAWIRDDAITDAAFLYDASGGRTFVKRGPRLVSGPDDVVSPASIEALGFQRALAMRAVADGFEGWLLVLDQEEPAIEDLAVAAMVSAQISVAVERWRTLLARRDVAAGQDRIRLARDLHDGVLQFLAGAALHLDAIARTPGLPPSAMERMRELGVSLKDEQRELRGFISAMRPPSAAGGGAKRPLGGELADICERLARHWSAEVTVDVQPVETAVSAELLFDLTRFVREAVANAVRHGSARRVALSVVEDQGMLRLTISDDGKGFPVQGVFSDEQLESAGVGPRSLQERARALGGRLELQSGAAGAAVTLLLPIRKAAA